MYSEEKDDSKRFLDEMAEELGVSRDALWSLAKLYISPSSTGINPTGEHLYMYLLFCKKHGLDPQAGQICGFIDKHGKLHIGVPNDGWLAIANRHPQFDGMQVEDIHDEAGQLKACKATVWRKDRKHPTEITEYMEECYRESREGHWDKRPHRMLRHKASTQALRYAFALTGFHDIEEAKEAAQVEERPPLQLEEGASQLDVMADAIEGDEERIAESENRVGQHEEVKVESETDTEDVDTVDDEVDTSFDEDAEKAALVEAILEAHGRCADSVFLEGLENTYGFDGPKDLKGKPLDVLVEIKEKLQERE